MANNVHADKSRSKKARLKAFLFACIFLGLYFAGNILAEVFLGHGICPVYNIIGVPCPGCGLTRALLSAIRFDFAAAFFYHPMWLFVAVFVAVWIVYYFVTGENIIDTQRIVLPVCLALVYVYIVRMCLLLPYQNPPMALNGDALLLRIIEAIKTLFSA